MEFICLISLAGVILLLLTHRFAVAGETPDKYRETITSKYYGE